MSPNCVFNRTRYDIGAMWLSWPAPVKKALEIMKGPLDEFEWHKVDATAAEKLTTLTILLVWFTRLTRPFYPPK